MNHHENINGSVSLEELREIAQRHPQARICNVIPRLQARVVADALKQPIKPRIRVKAGWRRDTKHGMRVIPGGLLEG